MNKKEYSTTVLSSFIFLTNAIHFYTCNDYYYALLFLFLFITSIIYHSNKNIYTLIIDKLAIFSVILYGCIMFYKKCENTNFCIIKSLIITTFLITMYLYFYGYIYKTYCFSKDNETGEIYHSLLHCISSIGHHMIMIL
jgi:hypothetical protein